MELVKIAGIVMVVSGALLMVWSFVAYAKQRLTENFGMIWGLVALCLTVIGIVLLAVELKPGVMLAVVVFLGIMLLLSLFGFSQAISVLIMKNQELAMQVSLLNQENESILQELTTAKEQSAHDE